VRGGGGAAGAGGRSGNGVLDVVTGDESDGES